MSIQKSLSQRTQRRNTSEKSAVIDCLCGKTYTFGHRTTHFKSKYHLKNLKNEPLDV